MTAWHCLFCDVGWDAVERGVCWSCGKGGMVLPLSDVVVLRSKSHHEMERLETGKYLKEEGYTG